MKTPDEFDEQIEISSQIFIALLHLIYDVFQAAFDHLDLQEREYFGLMFNDTGAAMPNGHSPDVMRYHFYLILH